MTQEQKEAVRNLLTKIKTAGYVGISIGFDGSGDSGCIENFAVFSEEDDFQIDEDYTWNHDMKEFSRTELQVLEDLFYAIDNESNYDWYNNDGGSGCLNIDLKTGQLQVHYNIRYTETNYFTNTYQAKDFTR